jgi:hypothetical protein
MEKENEELRTVETGCRVGQGSPRAVAPKNKNKRKQKKKFYVVQEIPS